MSNVEEVDVFVVVDIPRFKIATAGEQAEATQTTTGLGSEMITGKARNA